MNIAIFPARSGSKRIKNKNFKFFAGKPMIQHSIEVAKKSKLFNKIFISTDNPKISTKYKKYGATDFILRPKNLSDDNTITKPVIEHAIKEILKSDIKLDNICCIYPCTPFLRKEDLLKSFKLLKKNNNYFVYPVIKYPHPIQRSLGMYEDKKLFFREPKYELTKTQDLKIYYHDAGQFYWGSKEIWLSKKRMHSNGFGYDITDHLSVDIDYPEDWKFAEKVYLSLNEL